MVRARAWARQTGRSTGSAVALGMLGVVLVAGLVPAAMAPVGASDRPGQPSTERPTLLVVQPHQASERIRQRPAGVSDDPARGLVYRGLTRSSLCPGGFALVGVAGRAGCTTGPEALHDQPEPGGASEHVDDVSRERTTAELYDAAGTTEAAAEAAATGSVPCYGDGTSGSRVQAVYAVAADRVDRYGSIAPLIASTYAPRADAVFANSAAVGGQVRHIRWVTTPGCALDIIHAVLSPTGDDSLTNMRTELRALGLTRTDRKYVVWADATTYCGIGNIVGDSRPGADNAANRGPTFGRVDTGCWGYTSSVEAHELAHTLGAVQLDAPHSNGSWHCTDEYDRMCYNDGSGLPVTDVCPSAGESLFDCNGDDYFNVDPAPGSWLESHWNVADSVFLAASEPEPVPSVTATPDPTAGPTPDVTPSGTSSGVPTAGPAPSPTDSPTASPTPTPSPTTTVEGTRGGRLERSVRGQLTRADPREVIRVRARAGWVFATVSFRRADALHLTVRRVDGRVVAHRYGRSSLRVAEALRADTYRIVVRGEPTRFRLTLSYRR